MRMPFTRLAATLLLTALAAISKDRRALLVTGEESTAQVKLRAARLGGAEHAVELRHPRRYPLRFLRLDVNEPQKRLGRRCARPRLGRLLGYERAEGAAAGTLPEPAAGAVAALLARVLDGRLPHAPSLRAPSDGAARRPSRSSAGSGTKAAQTPPGARPSANRYSPS